MFCFIRIIPLLLAVFLFVGSVFSAEIRFDFESGNLEQEGWRIVQGENSKPIGNRTVEFHNQTEPYQKSGTFYLTTLEQTANANPTDDTNCIIESPVFRIEGNKIKFLVGGGQRPKTYVALCILADDAAEQETDQEVLKAAGKNNQKLDEIVWNVSEYVGKNAFFRVVDQETGGWAHIRADNFQLEGTLQSELTQKRWIDLQKRRIAQIRTELDQEFDSVRKALEDMKKTFFSDPDEYQSGLDFTRLFEGRVKRFFNELDKNPDLCQQHDFRKKVEHLKSSLIKDNPLVYQQPILYITRQQYLPDHHNTATLFQTGEINTSSFRGGSALKVWIPANAQTQEKTFTLLELPNGIVRDPCISFDATKVLLSIRKNIKDDYHLYEFDLDLQRPAITIYGSDSDEQIAKIPGLRQITFGKGISDIDPLYLPDGKILFGSTWEPKYCMCNRHIMCNLYTVEADGSDRQQIGHSTLFEGHPNLLSDGRVIYDRWEYVDRNFGDAQGVWVTNPDGTNHAIFWGNNTNSPGGVIDARVLPNSDSLFLCTFSSCHDRPWGAIALVDRRMGIDGKEAVLQTWPASAIDLVGVGNYDTFIQVKQKFEDPYPLSDTYFLASGMVDSIAERGREEMGIFLLDRFGNITLLHRDAPGCFDPTPLVPKAAPPAVASRIDLDASEGYFYVSNVYEGFGMQNVKPGSIKYLRVVESPEKRFWTHTHWDIGNGTQAPGMAWDDFNNKRILGTVDVEKDGSVFFALPADRFVYLQLLDENGMMIQSMRSGTMVRPGETNGCFGCHESRLDTPPKLSYNPIAMTKPPQSLRPWFGEERLFSFTHEVQPVFDKYCVTCHDFDGPGAKKLVLAGDRNLLFNASYKELRDKKYVSVVGAGPHQTLEAYTWGSNTSKLSKILLKGHPDPQIEQQRREKGLPFNKETDPEAFIRIITWIDINAPYYPTYASAYRNNRFGRSPLDDSQLKRLQELTEVDPLWTVSFDRPEKSPALQKLDQNSAAYREALDLIRKGQENLKNQDRGENPDFQPVDPIEIEQEKKYERLRKS